MNCGCENTREIFPECDKTRWEVQCSSYIEDASNYYTKKQVDDLIEGASGCCITPEEVDEKIDEAVSGKQDTLIASDNIIISGNVISAEVPSLNGYATEQWVEDKHYITGVDLSDYALKSEIPTVPTSNTAFTNDAGYLTEHQSLSAYSTTDEVNSAITEATSGLQQTLTAGRAISISNNTVALDLPIYKGSGSTNVSIGSTNGRLQGENKINSSFGAGIGWGLITQNTAESSIGGFNVSRNDNLQVFGTSGKTIFTIGNGSNDGNRHNAFEIRGNGDIYIVDTSASGEYYQKPMIKLQDNLGGGSGVTSGEVQSMIDNSISGKQDTLSAGTNVQINNNVISATDTKYTAGDNITISNQNVISTITKFWCGTQAQYDQITTKDPNTVYMIHS